MRISEIWPKVKIRRIDETDGPILSGDSLPIRIAADLAGLSPDDVIVECIVGNEDRHGEFQPYEHFIFDAIGENEKNETLFSINLKPSLPGKQLYKLRMYPSHRLLANRFEAGYMLWI